MAINSCLLWFIFTLIGPYCYYLVYNVNKVASLQEISFYNFLWFVKHNLQLPVSKNQPVTIEASEHKTPDMLAVASFPRSPLTPTFLFFLVRVRESLGTRLCLQQRKSGYHYLVFVY